MSTLNVSNPHRPRLLRLALCVSLGLLTALAIAFAPRTLMAMGVPPDGQPNTVNQAPTIGRVVTNLNDDGPGSLRQVVAESQPGDIIAFAPNVRGVISLTSGILITVPLTIAGPGADALAVSGDISPGALIAVDGAAVSISSLNMGNYGMYGRAIFNLGSLTLDKMRFGAGFEGIANGGILNVTNSVFEIDGWPALGNQPAPCFISAGVSTVGAASISNSNFIGGHDSWGVLNYYGAVILNNVTTSGSNGVLNGLPIGVGAGSCGPTRIGVMTITNSTIADGILNGTGSTLTVASSIVAACTGDITSLGYNLSDGSTCTFTATGDITGTNPMLAPLGDYGGPTATMMPLPGSPAIDAGNPADCPATDQRGVTRPIDGNGDSIATCDIGAVEFNLTKAFNLPIIGR